MSLNLELNVVDALTNAVINSKFFLENFGSIDGTSTYPFYDNDNDCIYARYTVGGKKKIVKIKVDLSVKDD